MSQSRSGELDSGAIDVGPLFRPLQVKTLRLENRVVMSPMTRSFAPNGVLEPEMTDYYRRRAEGGDGADRD
jgi:2,4-dienoyl-CoA reductase-like NADH-dependent reductase (Old Yellow Enzyme family)